MLKDVVLVVLVGLPASGKTSLAHMLESRLGKSLSVVSFDNLVKLDQSLIDQNLYKASRRLFIEAVEGLLRDESAVPTFVLVDDNNYYRSMRYVFYQMARRFGVSFAQIYVSVSLEEALSRDLSRPSPVGSRTIEAMNEKMEVPCISETWQRNTIQVEVANVDLETLEVFLLDSLKIKESSPPDRPPPATQSEIHEMDLVLRKIVGETVQSSSSKEVTAKKLNVRRKEIIEGLKNGALPGDLSREALKDLVLKDFCE